MRSARRDSKVAEGVIGKSLSSESAVCTSFEGSVIFCGPFVTGRTRCFAD